MRLERENPLTFLEFNYMILQAYDFLELNRRFKCTLQLGGSDQWGNMVRSCVSLLSVPRSLCSPSNSLCPVLPCAVSVAAACVG